MPTKFVRYSELTEDPIRQEKIRRAIAAKQGLTDHNNEAVAAMAAKSGVVITEDGAANVVNLPDYENPLGYLKSVGKGLLSAAIPAAAGMVAQAGTTAMLAPAAVAGGTAATPGVGTIAGGLGALGGGIVAGAGASLGTEMLQQKALEKFIPSWAEGLEIDRAINPKSNTIGAYLTGFGAARNKLSAIPGIVQKLTGKSTAGAIATEIGKRAAANAGLEAGQEMVLEDKKITELDPLRLGMSAIASPFQLKATPTGRKLQGAGERMADALDGRGRLQAAPPVLPRSRLELAQEIQALRSQGIVDPAAYTELAAQFNGTDPARTKVNVDALSTITDSVINQARLKDPVRLQTVAADAYELLAKGGDAAALPADPTIRKIATAHSTSPLSKEQWIELATAPDVDTALLKVREGNLPAEAQKAEVAKVAADKEAAALAERERLNAGNKVGIEIADQLMNADQRRQVAEVTYTALTTGTKPPANPLSGLLAKGYADGTIETLADAQRVADASVGTDPMAATKAAKSELQKLQVEKIALLNQQAIAKRQAAEGTVEANVIRDNRADRTAQVMGEDLLAGRARNVTPLNDPSKLLGPELPPADTTARPVAPANPVVTENPQYSGAKMPPQGTAGNLYSGIPVPEIMKWLRNEDPVAVPGSVHNPPVAESAAQIDKQIELTADTASSKSSTVISPGGYIPRYIPEGLDVIKTKHGLFIFNPKKVSREVVEKATSGDVIDGRILGLGSDGSNTSAGRLAVTTSIDGVPDALGEVVRSPEEARIASVNQQRAAPGGVTSVKPVEEVLSNRQENFNKWSEGSILRQPDNSLIPLYHGTRYEGSMDVIDPNARNTTGKPREAGPTGLWTTPNSDYAYNYASNYDSKNPATGPIYKMFANVKKLAAWPNKNGKIKMYINEGNDRKTVELPASNARLTQEQFVEYVKRFGRYPEYGWSLADGTNIKQNSKISPEKVYENWRTKEGPTVLHFEDYTNESQVTKGHISNHTERTLFNQILREHGYDALWKEGGGRGEIALLEGGSQIKSATGNDGTYDPNDPSILSMRLDAGLIPLLKKLPQATLKAINATVLRPLTYAGAPLHDRLRKLGPKGSALVDADLKMSSYERQKVAADYLDYMDVYNKLSPQEKVLLEKHDMDMKYHGVSSIELPPELLAKSQAITRVLQRQMYDRVAEGGPFVDGTRPAALKEGYRPEVTSREAWEVITQGSADMPDIKKRTEYLNMRNDWVEHRTQQGQTVAQALADWNEYKGLLSTGNLIESAKYGAVRRIEGFGLPASMRAPMEQALFTHSAKTHHDVGWFKYIQQNPEVAKFVGETDDGKGGTYQYNLEEEPLSNNTNVKAWLTDVNAGRTYDGNFTRFAQTIGQLATASRLGIKTAVRDFTLTPFIASTYVQGPADLIHMARGLVTTLSSSTKAAKLAGAIDPRGALSYDTTPEASPYANAGNKIYEIGQRVVNASRHLQGRAALENKARQWMFESGRLFALDRYGKPGAEKWFDKMEIPDWRTMDREDLADAVGAKMVQKVQGTYGREGLPPWLLQSGDQHAAAKLFFKLGRWGVERFNNWKKDAFDVAMNDGNFQPLLQSIAGGLLGAAAIQKIEEYLWSKKPNWLTWKEWMQAPGEYKETAYKLFNEIDTGSTMGTMASLVNSVNKVWAGEKATSFMANLGLEAADDMRIRIMQALGAIKDGGDVMPTLAKFAQAVAEDNIQIVKVINQRMSDTNGAREERIYKRQMGDTSGTVGELAPKNIMDPILPLREAKTLDEVMAATPAMTKSVMATGRAPSIQSPLRNINPDELNLAKPDYYSWLGQVQGPDVAGQQFAKDKQLDALTKFKRLAVEGAKAQTTASSLQELARKNAGPR